MLDPKMMKVAHELAALFQWYLVQRTLQHMDTARLRYALLNSSVGRLTAVQFGDLSPTDRAAYKRAAVVVMTYNADPREYIAAQFQAYEHYSQHLGKSILPLPGVLATLGSQARYTAYKLNQKERKDREAPVDRMNKKAFFREERKLKGMCNITRMPEEDILVQKPEEFSKKFLKAKGVWRVVKSIYMERVPA